MPVARRIHQIPAADRPREKLYKKGPLALSDFELLEVIVGTGSPGADVGTIARQVQKLLYKSPSALSHESLTTIKGVSNATAGKIMAALELAKRHLVRSAEPVRTMHDLITRLHDIRTKQQEYVVCLSFDGGDRLIAQRTVSIGTLDSVLAHPREIFADAIADRAAYVVLAHNHPSGEVNPSKKDISLTQQLAAAGQLLGVPLRDHIILTKSEHFSFRQHHYL
jgi:DNA repair protein RadC